MVVFFHVEIYIMLSSVDSSIADHQNKNAIFSGYQSRMQTGITTRQQSPVHIAIFSGCQSRMQTGIST